nr:hypothetical protein [uncultured Draconibacterium sp.]
MIDFEFRSLDNGLTSYPALSVSPVGLTAYRLSVDANGNSPQKLKGIKPPEMNLEKGFLSKKGQKSIRNAVYWFLYSVDKNIIIQGKGRKKVGFFTLTLPSKQVHSDKQIKKECLNQMLTELRADYNVKKYIWKAEKQENGNIHFHILTDTFLPVIEMRDKWNRIINKLGYVYEYSKRMKKMSGAEYTALRIQQYTKKHSKKPDSREIAKYLKAYDRGCNEKWRNPNSIDIESLKKVKNIGAYIGKYMSKEHKENEKEMNAAQKAEMKKRLSVEGRLWYSSGSVSKMKNLIIEAFEPEFPEFVDMISDVKHEKFLYETDYTLSLAVPVDILYKRGYTSIPRVFFDYSKDVFNGFQNSEFEKEKPENKTSGQKPSEEIIQSKFDFFEDLPKTKNLTDYH